MQARFHLTQRAAGVLCHPTSLPGPHGVGDLGPAAYEFVDFLHAAGQRWWQMLPINPPGPGNSPYSALSALAGSELLISLARLRDAGLLSAAELRPPADLPPARVTYRRAAQFKRARLHAAFEAFAGGGGLDSRAYEHYCQTEAAWLDDWALFAALRAAHRGQEWLRWPLGLRRRQPAALRAARQTLRRAVEFERFVQFELDQQWAALRAYAHERGVGFIGDVPIFVAHNSSDVWAQRALFDLRADGRAHTVSGVPPDYFSRTGQLWGHPHYRWSRHAATGFAWWLARFRRMFAQFDAVRIDHFLGFNRVWAVPGGAQTARRGKWVTTPGAALFTTLRRVLGPLEIIAEDLGLVVPEAVALRERFKLPGMRLLHFAFGNDAGDRYNQPHAYPRRCVVYPGTHDNETTVGWFQRLQREHPRQLRDLAQQSGDLAQPPHAAELTPFERVQRYTGTRGGEINWDLIRLAFLSPADTAIIPLQDVIGLDNRARMNTPATPRGNWEWRVRPAELTAARACRLRALAEAYGRCGPWEP